MTKEQILKKAIEKAVRGGMGNYICNLQTTIANGWHYKIIFSIAFAKSYWGEYSVWNDNGESSEYTSREGKNLKCMYSWQYHQHKMLDYIQEGKEPLRYIEKFLDK